MIRSRWFRRALPVALGLGPVLSLAAQEAQLATDRWNRAAMEWIGLLRDGAFAEAAERVDPEVPAGAMGADQLGTIWGQLTAQLGALGNVAPGPVAEQGKYHIVDLPAAFAVQKVVLRVVLTDSLQVSGFFVRPPAPPPYEPPSYVDTTSFEERDVTVGQDPWPLPGTLTLPAAPGPHPAVVLVHGSGPNDRDETLGGNRPFRDLAWGLATAGVAVLRYDKRTRVYGPRLPKDIGLEEEVIEDALAALEVARKEPAIDPERVFLLGHSLGAMLAPEIARRDGEVAGVVLLAAPVRPFFDVFRSQLAYLRSLEPDPASGAARQLDSLIAEVERAQAGEMGSDEALLGAPAGYWRELAAVDPIGTAGELSVPVLVLQGGRDYQSTPEDLALWRRALGDRPNFGFHLYPSLNHLFAAGEGTATPEEYAAQTKHVDEMVIRDLSSWMLAGGESRGEGGPSGS